MARNDDQRGFLGYLFRFLLILLFLGGIGLVAYAYFGDLSIEPQPRSQPFDLNRS